MSAVFSSVFEFTVFKPICLVLVCVHAFEGPSLMSGVSLDQSSTVSAESGLASSVRLGAVDRAGLTIQVCTFSGWNCKHVASDIYMSAGHFELQSSCVHDKYSATEPSPSPNS